MSPAVLTAAQLLATGILLASGPSSLSAAMPYAVPVEASGGGEPAPDQSDVQESGELQEADSWISAGSGSGDQLLPLSGQSPEPEAEEPETGSGDRGISQPGQMIVKKLRSDQVAPFIFSVLKQNKEHVVEVKKWVPEPREEEGMRDDMGEKDQWVSSRGSSPEKKEVFEVSVILPPAHLNTNSSALPSTEDQNKNEIPSIRTRGGFRTRGRFRPRGGFKSRIVTTPATAFPPTTSDPTEGTSTAVTATTTSANLRSSADAASTTAVTSASAVTRPSTEPATAVAIAPVTVLEVALSFDRPVTTSPLPVTSTGVSPVVATTGAAHLDGIAGGPGDFQRELRQEFCRTPFICVFHGWAIICVFFLLFLLVRSVCINGVSAVRWCCQLRYRCRQSDTMRAIEFVNIGMDRQSWGNKSACSVRIREEIEKRLRELFSRCDVTLEMVGSLSSRLGKSLNARPESEDSLQEYRFTEPVLGADADFMVVLQVPVAPTAAGGRELPRYMLEGVPPYITLSPLTGSGSGSGPPLPRSWTQEAVRPGSPDGEAELELQEFGPCPDTALSVCPVSETPTPLTPRPAGGDGNGFYWPTAGQQRSVSVGPLTGQSCRRDSVSVGSLAGHCLFTAGAEEDSVSLVTAPARTDPDGGETGKMQRSASLNEVPTLLRLPTLEASRGDSTPPGFARVQLFLDRVLPEDRPWWRDHMSEPTDGALYLSSKKARQLMGDMFETLELNVEQDRPSMSVVDRCLADYRGEPSYIQDVKARGPAVTLKLTQSDDRAIANMTFFQNSCCYWMCLCVSVILLLPFCVWIFLTGGSWPVRKCTGGACCSIYYAVTLLVPMVLVLPALLVLLAVRRPETDDEANQLHIALVVAYVALSAFCASLFVCVSQCFFKLPTIFYGDFVTALVCPQWPRDARRFKVRSRQWPPRAEVDGIVRQGCHLVPKPPVPCRCLDVNGHAPCDEAHLLWRYSFSKAEVRLSKSIPEHYRRAYMTFKWLVKKYITKSNCPTYRVGSNMRSYYLKTVLFWELDHRGPVEWYEGVEVELLDRLARRLLQHIQQRHLPHFFIPKINLLDELTRTDFEQVERLMKEVLVDPAPLIIMPELKWKACTIGLCEAIFCTPGRDFRSELCCNYASRLPSVW